MVGARSREPDFQDVVGSAPRMKHRAPPACTVGVDQICDRRNNPRLRQCICDKRAFPKMVLGK